MGVLLDVAGSVGAGVSDVVERSPRFVTVCVLLQSLAVRQSYCVFMVTEWRASLLGDRRPILDADVRLRFEPENQLRLLRE